MTTQEETGADSINQVVVAVTVGVAVEVPSLLVAIGGNNAHKQLGPLLLPMFNNFRQPRAAEKLDVRFADKAQN